MEQRPQYIVSAHSDPWDHADWFDLHLDAWTAGPERAAEQREEAVAALPPLDRENHVVVIGAGTGRLAEQVMKAYPYLGTLTLIEPRTLLLDRALARLQPLCPATQLVPIAAGIGDGQDFPRGIGTVALLENVLGSKVGRGERTLTDSLRWIRRALLDLASLLGDGATLCLLEELADLRALTLPPAHPRRLHLGELSAELSQAGFEEVECRYRYRDRVVVTARLPG